jgi:SAM-dependent methyltransferase
MVDEISRFGPARGMRLAMYRLLFACSGILLRAANGCVFAAAGLLRPEERQAAISEEWGYLNLSNEDVDAGLTREEQELYSRFLRPSDIVLLVGCGSGRDLLGLRLMGYDVDGLEPHPGLVELARANLARRGLGGSVRTGIIQRAEFDRPYTAIVFTAACYSMMPGSEARVAALSRIRAFLPREGRVILSYYPSKKHSALGRRLTGVVAAIARSGWSPEKGDMFWRHHLVPGVVAFCHVFEAEEFQRECTQAGFKILAQENFDDRFCYVALR